VSVPSAVELFGDPWHGDQCDGGGDDVELQVAQPGQILQMGIAHKVDRHIVSQQNGHCVVSVFDFLSVCASVRGFSML
jgi:hypothetical protein